jgi:hypothetical protein
MDNRWIMTPYFLNNENICDELSDNLLYFYKKFKKIKK